MRLRVAAPARRRAAATAPTRARRFTTSRGAEPKPANRPASSLRAAIDSDKPSPINQVTQAPANTATTPMKNTFHMSGSPMVDDRMLLRNELRMQRIQWPLAGPTEALAGTPRMNHFRRVRCLSSKTILRSSR